MDDLPSCPTEPEILSLSTNPLPRQHLKHDLFLSQLQQLSRITQEIPPQHHLPATYRLHLHRRLQQHRKSHNTVFSTTSLVRVQTRSPSRRMSSLLSSRRRTMVKFPLAASHIKLTKSRMVARKDSYWSRLGSLRISQGRSTPTTTSRTRHPSYSAPTSTRGFPT